MSTVWAGTEPEMSPTRRAAVIAREYMWHLSGSGRNHRGHLDASEGNNRPDVPVRVLPLLRQRRELHHRVGQLRPAEHHGVLLRVALERTPEVIDDHRGPGEFLDERLEAGGVAGLEVKLDRQPQVADVIP